MSSHAVYAFVFPSLVAIPCVVNRATFVSTTRHPHDRESPHFRLSPFTIFSVPQSQRTLQYTLRLDVRAYSTTTHRPNLWPLRSIRLLIISPHARRWFATCRSAS